MKPSASFSCAALATFSLAMPAGANVIYSNLLNTTIPLNFTGDTINAYNGTTTASSGTLAVGGSGSINNSAVTLNGGTFRYNSSVAYSNGLTFTSGTLGGTNLTGTLGAFSVVLGGSPGIGGDNTQIYLSYGIPIPELRGILLAGLCAVVLLHRRSSFPARPGPQTDSCRDLANAIRNTKDSIKNRIHLPVARHGATRPKSWQADVRLTTSPPFHHLKEHREKSDFDTVSMTS